MECDCNKRRVSGKCKGVNFRNANRYGENRKPNEISFQLEFVSFGLCVVANGAFAASKFEIDEKENAMCVEHAARGASVLVNNARRREADTIAWRISSASTFDGHFG